ncbi:hypothetical protein F5884DRAFT_708406 [Xylogone sp. PMI_703]|nr:hypothetical protein F5884DRAFT_708406 [Xylogone sp. PMI_703]
MKMERIKQFILKYSMKNSQDHDLRPSETIALAQPTLPDDELDNSPADSDEKDLEYPVAISSKKHRRFNDSRIFVYILFLWKTIICLLAVYGIISLVRQWSHAAQPKTPLSCNCGHSVDEAISMGCKYDPLAAAWLPDHCRDKELSEEFDKAGPGPNGSWSYYSDKYGTRQLNVTEISYYANNRSAQYWSTYEWHVVHCIFYWRKQFRARFTGVTVEKRFDTEAHIKHCGKMFMLRKPFNFIDTFQGASLYSDGHDSA